jgi:porin
MPTNHGFDFGLGGSRGALIPVEVGYETTLANDPYPRRYDIGAVIDRTSYDSVTYNPASMTMGSTAGHGREMIYGQARQVVYRPDMTSPRGVTLFGAVIVGPDSNQPVDYDVTGGAVYLGPFAARPLDSIGIAADLTHYRSRFIDQLLDYRISALGGSQRPSSMLVMTELHYQFAVTSWLNIMPDVQYIFNPDGLGTLPYPKANLPNAWVFGIKFAAEWK